MPTKILIINSLIEKSPLLINALKELELKDLAFSLWSSKKNLLKQFLKNGWTAKKIYLGPNLQNKKNALFFLLVLPFLELKFLISLIKLKIKKQINLIICLNFNEKIIFTPLAKLFKIKIIWLEAPDSDYLKINKFLLLAYKINHQLSTIVTLNNYTKLQLTNLNFKENKIYRISPGVKISQYQDNIFNKLAAINQKDYSRKYFTVGLVTELNQKQKIEIIFQAIKTCLPVIPNLQLIIIGEGEERKNLTWLSKKMGIENLVWLVGEQEPLKKWLTSFDIFLALSDSTKLDNYNNILEAMSLGLVIIGPRNIGLEDLIIENKNGSLLEADNNEMLARQIIKLHQDKRLRLSLGKNCQERIAQFFTLKQMVEALEKVVKAK